MVKKLVTDIANGMGMRLSTISLVNGVRLGCLGAHLLHLSKDGRNVSALIYDSELSSLLNGGEPDQRLVLRLQTSISRLQAMVSEAASTYAADAVPANRHDNSVV